MKINCNNHIVVMKTTHIYFKYYTSYEEIKRQDKLRKNSLPSDNTIASNLYC